jgi:alcohol dehydrogenase YqhD (iron-dependent ADH family)
MMTGVEIWRLEGGCKEIEKVREMFFKRIFGVPSTAANGACVRELGRTNRKEKVVERIVKYRKRLWEMDETSLLREALKQQTIEKGENWLKKLEQELNRLDMRDVWRRGGENNNNVWKVVSKRCIDTERQKMEANVREKDLWRYIMN